MKMLILKSVVWVLFFLVVSFCVALGIFGLSVLCALILSIALPLIKIDYALIYFVSLALGVFATLASPITNIQDFSDFIDEIMDKED